MDGLTRAPSIHQAHRLSPDSESGGLSVTHRDFSGDRLIHDLFEEQVTLTPNAIAVVHEHSSIKYLELNDRADRVAQHLVACGIGPGDLVALCVERSIDMVVGMLAILKAGGAYVPLDPAYPPDRLRYMLEDSAPKVVLTQSLLRQSLASFARRLLCVDEVADDVRAACRRSESGGMALSPATLAYVIYTSGSTGRPKGVMVPHCGVVNFLASMRQHPGIRATDRLLAVTTICFDIAALEIFLPIVSGASVVIASRTVALDAGRLSKEIQEYGITILQATPATWRMLIASGWEGQRQLKALCGGEAMTSDLSAALLSRVAELWNLYGPTETTIWSCTNMIGVPSNELTESVGKPIANTQVYILREDRSPVSLGETGEIYIGGAGVARGYLNKPDLTALRFLEDPFRSDKAARMYRTGDLGRWNTDGTIQYLGRNDHQVKIRGFRIELGEIEALLKQHSRIRDAVVTAHEVSSGEKMLVAYVAAAQHTSPSSVEIRNYLKGFLPDYMIPAAFVSLDQLPLTPNGKLDRASLPMPDIHAYASECYEAPQGIQEQALTSIWQGLLHIQRVGRNDNFFELGGYSLLAVRMIQQLRKVGFTADLTAVYGTNSLAELAGTLRPAHQAQAVPPVPLRIPPDCRAISPCMLPMVQLTEEEIGRIVQCTPGGAANILDVLPLLPLQEGILFHHLLRSGAGDTYVRPMLLALDSKLHVIQLTKALQHVIDRHEILRTAFLWEHLSRPVQVISRHAALPIEELVLEGADDPMAELQERLKPERQSIDIRSAPLLRLTIASMRRRRAHFALLQIHHLVFDDESLSKLLAEVGAYVVSAQPDIVQGGSSYREYVISVLREVEKQDAESFFRRKLSDIDSPTAPFMVLSDRADIQSICEHSLQLDPLLTDRLRQTARQCGVSAATLFHAAWAIFVGRTSAREDVVFGTVLGHMRAIDNSREVLGMLINTLPMRLQLRDVRVRDFIGKVHRELIELMGQQHASLAVAQRASAVPGSLPLFTSLLNYIKNVGHGQTDTALAPGVRLIEAREWTNYPLVLTVDDREDQIFLNLQADRRIDAERTLKLVCHTLQVMTDALRLTPAATVRSVVVLPEADRRRVVEQFNATRREFPAGCLIHEVFEEWACRTPEAIALASEEGSLTYEELNDRANRLARELRALGARPGDIVPIFMARSLRLVISQLAILKCGCAYLPADPTLPEQRKQFLLRDANASLVLADDPQPENAVFDAFRWIEYGTASSSAGGRSGGNLRLTLEAQLPAYVMYTSGSTGLPKGVIVPHRAISRLVLNNTFATIEPTDCVSYNSNPAFDASTFEVWGALLNGARALVVPTEVVLEPRRFAELLLNHSVTIMFLTTSLFAQYADSLAPVFRTLRYLITGGEAVDPQVVARVLENGGPEHLLNAYGPTECTTFATTYEIPQRELPSGNVPIGRPISNTSVYILDAEGQPVPLDVAGEIYIGGPGVALGYLNRPQLTSERFVADPFSREPGAVLYKTGDFARWRVDGNIEFIGRDDGQVKLRGFRIELAEVEAQLLRHPGVREAAVLVHKNTTGDRYLVAYVTPRETPARQSLSLQDLRTQLEIVLPNYMVPSAFVILDRLPLTSNGKLDKRALAERETTAYVTKEYEPPAGQIELAVCAIWRKLLHKQCIGREDNFFHIGGHSLLATRVMTHVNDEFELNMPLRALFDGPTIKALSARIMDEIAAELAAEAR
jgi:amino acid adenylation domain-containing protein